MKYTNSIAIVRTKKGSVVGCHMIATYGYLKVNPDRYDYKGTLGKEFEICENVGGQIKVIATDKLKHSGVDIVNTVTFSNVTSIEILTEFEM